jgi:transposase
METKEEQKKQRRPRRIHTAEFKAEAVKLVVEKGLSNTRVAKDLDVAVSSVGQWVEQARADGGKSKRGTLTTDEKEELARLRKENRVLRVERDILKKAAAFFAKENA